MPLKLTVECAFVKWRVRVEDLALLEALFGEGNVNTVVREEIIHRYCDALRARGLRQQSAG